MSAQKISELLHNHAMIDYNLISDSLSSILCEMCQIITDQGAEIDALKSEIPKFAIKSEIESKLQVQSESFSSVQTGMNNVCEATQQKFDTVAQTIQLNVNRINNQFAELKKQIDNENQQKFKEVQGEFYISNQQIKDLTSSINKHKALIEENKNDVDKIHEFLNKAQDQTIDVLSAKLVALTEKVANMEEVQKSEKLETDQTTDEIKAAITKFKEDAKDEFSFLETDLKELRRLIVDAPSIDLDGVHDTEALVRAIQRDSRRIDGFNETINSIRDEHGEMRFLFTELTQGFQKIQINLLDFVTEHNKVKKDIILLTQDNQARCNTLKHNFGTCFTNIQSVLDAALNGMNLVSNTFVQIFSFLGKITTRPLPLFTAFDDSLLEFQRLSDSISAQNEKFDDINKSDEKKTPRKVPDEPFKIPTVTIADVPCLMAQRQSAISRIENSEFASSSSKAKAKVLNAQSSNFSQQSIIQPNSSDSSQLQQSATQQQQGRIISAGVDIELRQNVRDLQSKIDESLATVTHLKDTVEERIERKSDTVAMERMMEKIRLMIGKLRDQLNGQNKALMTCVQRSEAEALIQQVLETMNTGGETAAGSNHFECLMCGRPKTSLTGGNLPKLTNGTGTMLSTMGVGQPQNPYEAVYGRLFEGASPIPSERGRTATAKSDRPVRGHSPPTNMLQVRMKTPQLRKL